MKLPDDNRVLMLLSGNVFKHTHKDLIDGHILKFEFIQGDE